MRLSLLGLALTTTLCAAPIAAQAQAPITIYCSILEEQCRVGVAAFEKATGAKATMVRKSTGETLAQIRAEASNPRADVWWGGPGDSHIQAAEEGLTVEYKSPKLPELHDWAQRHAEQSKFRTNGIYLGALGVGYNTEVLKKKGIAAPKCWADLLDPKLRDEVQIADPSSSGTAYVFLATTVQRLGEEKGFVFKALNPGLYVYHCATPPVAQHISAGMYGLILVEPEGGLPKVDREFYVMQGELYTEEAIGTKGEATESYDKLIAEQPEYFVFNGAVGALSKIHTLKANVGETVRIFFGVGGPNHTSSFHVIGEIFDRIYNLADVLSPPARGIQTVTVPAGGATIVEFKLDVPGNYILVDHALSRAERGLIGILHAEGPANPEIFEGQVDTLAGH